MSAALLAAGIAAPVLGGLIGNEQAKGSDRAARKALQEQQARLAGLSLPDFLKTLPELPEYTDAPNAPEQQALNAATFERLKSAGQLTPDMIQALQQDRTELSSTYMDPGLRAAQQQALSQLQGIGTEGGLNATDRAQLARIQSQSAQADRGSREAIMQNMNARGMGGSGMELIQKLSSQQAATDRNAQQGLDVAAMAQRRALEALMQSGQLAGSMSQEDLQMQERRASAQDSINRFNTQNSQSILGTNVDARNSAQLNNLNRAQGISDGNTGIRNDEIKNNQNVILDNNKIGQQQFGNNVLRAEMRNDITDKRYGNSMGQIGITNDLKQRDFDNSLSKVTGQGRVSEAMSSNYQRQGDNTRAIGAGIGAGIGKVASGAIDYYGKDEDKDK